MKDFNLIGNRLEYCVTEKQQREDRRIYNAEIAKIAGVSRAAVTNWMQNTNGMDAVYARPLAEFFSVDPLWLETGEGSPERKKKDAVKELGELIDLNDNNNTVAIRRVEFKISAGISGYAIEYINGEKSPISFRKDWMERKGWFSNKLYAIEVKGESMEPNYYEGDLIVINTADTKHIDGKPYAFNYDGELVIKRLSKIRGEWYLSSDNIDKIRFPDKPCDESCFVIGIVVYRQTERV